MTRTFWDFRRLIGVVWSLAFFFLFVVQASSVYAQSSRERERVKSLARVVQGVPDFFFDQTRGPLGERSEAFFSAPSGVGGFPSATESPRSVYRVGSAKLSWRSRDGKEYDAIVYHPTRPPVGGSKFGIVIYSHGLGASPEEFSYLGREWASRGVVCITLSHPASDDSVWRGKARPMAALKEAYHKYWSGRDRAMAIRSAIDYVYASHNRPGPLGLDVDLRKIAVAGNDLGALGALLVAGQLPPDNGPSLRDNRVAAVLALSPPVFCEAELGAEVYAGVTVPLMVVTGTKDDGIVGSTKARQRRLPYDSVSRSDRYLVVLDGGDHRVYGRRIVGSDESFHKTISAETSDYLSAYLLGDYDVLMELRERGSTFSLKNASVEKALRPLPYANFETVGAISESDLF